MPMEPVIDETTGEVLGYKAEARLLTWSTNPSAGHWIKLGLDTATDEAHPFQAERFGSEHGQLYEVILKPIEEA